MNTLVTILYRDASNYKTHQEIVFSGEFDKDLVREMIGAEFHFIPEVAGINRLSIGSASGLPTCDDHIYHEIAEESFELTDRKPTDPRTIDQFLEALLKPATQEEIDTAIENLYSEGMQIYGENDCYAVIPPPTIFPHTTLTAPSLKTSTGSPSKPGNFTNGGIRLNTTTTFNKPVFYEPGSTCLIDLVNPETMRAVISKENLAEIRKRYPTAVCMELDDAVNEIQQIDHKQLIEPKARLISEEDWEFALECLPPSRFDTTSGIEHFHICERLTGNIVAWYTRDKEGNHVTFNDLASISLDRVVERHREALPVNP